MPEYRTPPRRTTTQDPNVQWQANDNDRTERYFTDTGSERYWPGTGERSNRWAHWRSKDSSVLSDKQTQAMRDYQQMAAYAGAGRLAGSGQDQTQVQSQGWAQQYGQGLLAKATGQWGKRPMMYSGSIYGAQPQAGMRQPAQAAPTNREGQVRVDPNASGGAFAGAVTNVRVPLTNAQESGGQRMLKDNTAAPPPPDGRIGDLIDPGRLTDQGGLSDGLIEAQPGNDFAGLAGSDPGSQDLRTHDGPPTTAQDQYIQGVRKQQTNALSIARSMRGQNYAQSRQAVASAQSRAAQEGDVGLQAMQAQEQDQARNQYAQFVNDQRGLSQQDYFGRLGNQQDMQRFYEGLGNEQRKGAMGSQLAYDQMGASQQMQEYALEQRRKAIEKANSWQEQLKDVGKSAIGTAAGMAPLLLMA